MVVRSQTRLGEPPMMMVERPPTSSVEEIATEERRTRPLQRPVDVRLLRQLLHHVPPRVTNAVSVRAKTQREHPFVSDRWRVVGSASFCVSVQSGRVQVFPIVHFQKNVEESPGRRRISRRR